MVLQINKNKEIVKVMRTNFYLNNKKVTRSFLESLAGRETVKRWVEDAKYDYHRDHRTDPTRYTRWGLVTFVFKF